MLKQIVVLLSIGVLAQVPAIYSELAQVHRSNDESSVRAAFQQWRAGQSLQSIQTESNITQEAPHMRATCPGRVEDRVDCYPESGASQAACEARGCCWVGYTGNLLDVPFCFFPNDYPDYDIRNIVTTNFGYRFDAVRSTPVSFRPNNIMSLKGEIYFFTGGIVRLRLTDPSNSRWEVPIKLGVKEIADPLTWPKISMTRNGKLKLTSTRSNDVKIEFLSTAPIIFADQFIQVSLKLDGDRVYGIGERYGSFRIPSDKGFSLIPLWATDRAPGRWSTNKEGGNLYGVHPFALVLNKQGHSSGFFALNSNAMEFVVSPAPAITFRTIGGIVDLFFFTGDTTNSSYADATVRESGVSYPDTIIKQYWRLIHGGRRVQMPPYWALGFHLCRWGYNTDSNLETVINRNIAIGMPFDAQWADIDYMVKELDWTISSSFNRLPQIVNNLHARNMRFIPIVDPAISNEQPSGTYPPWDRGVQMDVFIKFFGNIAIGKVWPGLTAFPDFTKTQTYEWWYMDMRDFYNRVKYDGLWIDMNEPANFYDGTTRGCANPGENGHLLDEPPFKPSVPDSGSFRKLWKNTMCLSATQNISTHYNLHNLYGYFELLATYSGIQRLIANERPFILTRSTFAGSGAYGFHWTGDVQSTWDDLARSVPSVVSFGFFGIPFVGADICGFGQSTNEELCIRWQQVGSFYPFMRNHNDKQSREQDPAVWSSFAQGAMRNAALIRYQLLPYLYSLFSLATSSDIMPVRPLFMLAPFDEATHNIDDQFTWGDALIITPVLKPGARNVWGYFPNITLPYTNVRTVYYAFLSGLPLFGGYWVDLAAPLDQIPLHVKGGSILPMQLPGQSTFASRKNPFQLLVALTYEKSASSPGWAGQAKGFLYLDDSVSQNSQSSGKFSIISFEATQSIISSKVDLGYNPEVDGASRGESSALNLIKVYGVQTQPRSVSIDGVSGSPTYSYDSMNLVLILQNLNLKVTSAFTLRLSY